MKVIIMKEKKSKVISISWIKQHIAQTNFKLNGLMDG